MQLLTEDEAMKDINVWISPCETVRLYNGDCRVVCAMLAEGGERVASIITDPPYGLGFMGKDWDAGGFSTHQRRQRQRKRGGLAVCVCLW